MESINARESLFKRRPKGTGSVYKLSGSRSKPYVAALTTGRNLDTGKQIQTPQGYFKTKEEAIDCLTLCMLKANNILPNEIVGVPKLEYKYVEFIYQMIEQRILPRDVREIQDTSLINSMFMVKVAQEGININNERLVEIGKSTPTVEEIWERLLETDLAHLTDRSLQNYTVSYRNLSFLHNKPINTITFKDIDPIFKELMKKGTGGSKMNNMKIVLNYIFKYAMKYDWVEKNYAELINFKDTLSEEDKLHKTAYDKSTIKALYSLADTDLIAASILVMAWTGMRPSELLLVKKEDVHLEERYMIGGIKTKAGINRVIPIHECIVPYVEKMIKESDTNLLFAVSNTYNNYLSRFNNLMKKLKIATKYTPHCGRHTFATLCNEFELNDYLIKVIIGHSAKDLTKDVYTHTKIERLVEEINKLPSIKAYI